MCGITNRYSTHNFFDSERNDCMNINYGFQVYQPGQIWRMRLKESDVTDNKYRPYLIIGSVKRRITVLKLTHGGSYSSNWIYKLENPNGSTSNIILDTPSVIDVNNIDIDYSYMYSLSRPLFMDIYKQFIAAMLYESTFDNEILTDESVASIKSIIDNHVDNMYAFSRYGTIPRDRDFDDDNNGTAEIIDASIDNDTTDDTIVGDIAEAIAAVEEEEDANDEDVIEVISDECDESDDNEEIKHHRRPRKDYPKTCAEDLVIFGEGHTHIDMVNKVFTEFGISNIKFELSNLCMRGKCVYINNKYNFTLKSRLNKDDANPKKRRNLGKYKSIMKQDIEKYGSSRAAAIWGISIATLHYYTKIKGA